MLFAECSREIGEKGVHAMSTRLRIVLRLLACAGAVILCRVRCDGIAPIDPERVPKNFDALTITPHVLSVLVVLWAIRVNLAAIIVALIGASLVAWMPWWDQQANRQTEGFEHNFDNAVGAGFCLMGTYGIVLLTAFCVFIARVVGKELDQAPTSPPAGSSLTV